MLLPLHGAFSHTMLPLLHSGIPASCSLDLERGEQNGSVEKEKVERGIFLAYHSSALPIFPPLPFQILAAKEGGAEEGV